MTNYNEIVDKCRELSRDYLRMLRINELRAKILTINNGIDELQKVAEDYNKQVLILEYKKSKVDTAHPDFENEIKKLDENINSYNEMLKRNNEVMEEYKANLKDKTEKIERVNSGEYKVDKDYLNLNTEKLVNEVIREAAKSIEVK